jgi:hypothetical protein
VSAALEKTLSEKNIKNSFKTTGIFLFNFHSMEEKMDPSNFYRQAHVTMAGNMDKPEAIDLVAPQILHRSEDTFVNHVDLGRGQQCK